MYKWKCPVCDKTIYSIYREQLKANAVNHLMKHLRRNDIKNISVDEVDKQITEE